MHSAILSISPGCSMVECNGGPLVFNFQMFFFPVVYFLFFMIVLLWQAKICTTNIDLSILVFLQLLTSHSEHRIEARETAIRQNEGSIRA